METIQELFQYMEKNAEKNAIMTYEQKLTYDQLIKKSCSLASGLKQVINPGDKIAVLVPNSINWILIELAAGLLGATVVTLNMRYKKHEIGYILRDSQSKILIFQPELENYNYTSMVKDIINENELPNLKYLISTIGILEDFKIKNQTLSQYFKEDYFNYNSFSNDSNNPQNIINIMYTSGTTSNPKGVMITQRAAIKHPFNVTKYLHINSEDVVLGSLPFCGVMGFNTMMASLVAGASIIPMERYKATDALELIERFKCTIFSGVDGMITPLFDKPDINKDLSSVRMGAYPIFSTNFQEFIEKTEEIFPNMKVVQPYGMTEVASMIFVGNPKESIEIRSLPGGPAISSEIIVDIIAQDTGEPLGYGEEGEIVVGGYTVMSGYYGQPEKTKESFTNDGKFKTGDLGVKLADGSILYKGRLRDALRLKGFLVSPKEIEDYICLIPEIEIVQMVQVIIENKERLVGFVQLKQGRQLKEESIFEFCKEGLADFKCPQDIIFINEFPTTAGSNGEKIQRNKLQEIAKEKLKQTDFA